MCPPWAAIFSTRRSTILWNEIFVSAFTEGLYHELAQDVDAKMQAKILAPAATKSEFCDVASGKSGFDYDASFEKYHSSEQTADFCSPFMIAMHVLARWI